MRLVSQSRLPAALPGSSAPRVVAPSFPTPCHTRLAVPRPNRVSPKTALQGQRLPPCQAVEVQNGVVSVEEEIKQLRAENAMLRKQLAELQASASSAAVAVVAEPEVAAAPPGESALESGIIWPAPGEKFWERAPRSTPCPISGRDPCKPPQERDPHTLEVVHITAEMAPIAKVGGLGDVVTGLARASLARGHKVTVMLPFYECLPKDQIQDLKHEFEFEVPKGRSWDGEMQMGSLRTSVYWGRISGCPVYLVKPVDGSGSNIFRGTRIYGGSYNEMEAYLYFCRACLEYLSLTNQRPNVVQLHDWHAAAASLLFWEVYNPSGEWRSRIMLTIHNMDNTGECRQDEFCFTGVNGTVFANVDKALDERTIGHNPERLNLMKGGVVYSNAVTTVSPTYANEILNAGAAGWLRSTLVRPEIGSKFHGILNGIDADEWNPATDPIAPANFNGENPQGKALCKEFLQQGLGLEINPSKPLVAVVSRLVPQKGIHLIKAALYRTVQQGGQFVLLGSGHSDGVFKQLATGEFRDNPNCRLMIMYSERLAHQIYAAADFVVVPSMFEPCGLTQLIALRYGAVPVVRKTGGLADTVFDVDSGAANANGYVFEGSDDGSLHKALDRALALYKEQPERFAALATANMQQDVSWGASAKAYVGLYNSLSR